MVVGRRQKKRKDDDLEENQVDSLAEITLIEFLVWLSCWTMVLITPFFMMYADNPEHALLTFFLVTPPASILFFTLLKQRM